MENTIYGLFQETVNKNRSNVAIIENKRTEKVFLESSGVAKKLYHEIGFADMEDHMKLGDKEYAD